MIQDRLMINDDKTKFLLVGTRQQLDKLDSCFITVGNNRITPSPCVKDGAHYCYSAHFLRMPR